MRLIDSDPLKIKMLETADALGGSLPLITALNLIDAAPTLCDIQNGNWEQKEICLLGTEVHIPYTKCFICGSAPLHNETGEFVLSNYCPNCGALMRQNSED